MKTPKLFLTCLILAATIIASGQGKTERMRPALLVIDIQNQFLPWVPDQDKEQALYAINAYIDLFRSYGFPVVRVYHQEIGEGPDPGTEAFEFPKTVNIKPEDPMVIKHYANAFNKTDLAKILTDLNCNTVFLTGLSSVGCVLATYFGAMDADLHGFMVREAIMSHNTSYTESVSEIFGAIGYDVIKVMLDNAER